MALQVLDIDRGVATTPLRGQVDWILFSEPVALVDLQRMTEVAAGHGMAHYYGPVEGHPDEAWMVTP